LAVHSAIIRFNKTLVDFMGVFILEIDVFSPDGVCFRARGSEKHSILDSATRNFKTDCLGD